MGCSAQKDKVKEEPPSGAAIPAGGPAGTVNKAVVISGLEISLDLPGAAGLDISDLLFSSPPQPKQEASSEEEWENADTGEPVSAEKVRAKRFRVGRPHWEFLQQTPFIVAVLQEAPFAMMKLSKTSGGQALSVHEDEY